MPLPKEAQHDGEGRRHTIERAGAREARAMSGPVRIVVLGGSFGGLTTAYELRRRLGPEQDPPRRSTGGHRRART